MRFVRCRSRTPFILALVVAACASSGSPSPSVSLASEGVLWTRLLTADVHSLAFAPDEMDHLYFGYHFGVMESVDGGRTWRQLGGRADAMSFGVGDGTTLYIAGHEVFQVSGDGGRTWADIEADLPSLDIHGFTRDPADGQHMWAYLAQGGVFESTDGGVDWRRVSESHIPFVTAVREGDLTVLLGLDPFTGIVRSADGGATWTLVSRPPTSPVVSLSATPDGAIILVGGPDGLYRSDDHGSTWRQVLAVELPLAIAVSPDGEVVAAVSRDTAFYRSDDGGATWPGP